MKMWKNLAKRNWKGKILLNKRRSQSKTQKKCVKVIVRSFFFNLIKTKILHGIVDLRKIISIKIAFKSILVTL